MKIKQSIEIANSPEQVFLWVDDPEKARLWQKQVKKTEIIRQTPEKVGTTFREELEENGKTLIIHGKVTNHIPNELIAFRLDSKIHTVEAEFSVSGSENLTIFSGSWQIKWKFPMNLVTFFLGKKIKANILEQSRKEFADLKKLCEST